MPNPNPPQSSAPPPGPENRTSKFGGVDVALQRLGSIRLCPYVLLLPLSNFALSSRHVEIGISVRNIGIRCEVVVDLVGQCPFSTGFALHVRNPVASTAMGQSLFAGHRTMVDSFRPSEHSGSQHQCHHPRPYGSCGRIETVNAGRHMRQKAVSNGGPRLSTAVHANFSLHFTSCVVKYATYSRLKLLC